MVIHQPRQLTEGSICHRCPPEKSFRFFAHSYILFAKVFVFLQRDKAFRIAVKQEKI